jgi:hypothetical protein
VLKEKEKTFLSYGDIVVQKTNGVVINYELGGIIHLYELVLGNASSDIDNEATFYPNCTINVVKLAPNGFSFKTYQELMDVRPFKDINDTAQRFIDRDKSNLDFLNNSTKVFTSDYGLYWFIICPVTMLFLAKSGGTCH